MNIFDRLKQGEEIPLDVPTNTVVAGVPARIVKQWP
jgi:acetyltransferase-like isoleucine patch superfamily enzyme